MLLNGTTRISSSSVKGTTVSDEQQTAVGFFLQIATVFPVFLILAALIGNTLSFLIFRLDYEMKKMSSLMYLSLVAIFDTVALFEWNLNHFLFAKYKSRIEDYGVRTCKVTTFIQFFTLQTSALLLSMTCIDRYVTIASTPGSIFSVLPFSTARSALGWSLVLTTISALTNLHLIIIPSDPVVLNGTFICHEFQKTHTTVPMWLKANVFIYGCVPFAIMVLFNGLIIKKTISIRKYLLLNRQASLIDFRANRKRQRLTISLVVITFSFLLMTLPANIAFAYFINDIFSSSDQFKSLVSVLLDNLFFSNNASLFFFSYLSNPKFRQAVKRLASCDWNMSPGLGTSVRRKRKSEGTSMDLSSAKRFSSLTTTLDTQPRRVMVKRSF